MTATPTAFARIVGAMQSLLEQSPAVSANVFRIRSRVVPRQMADAIVIRPGEAQVDSGVGTAVPGIWLTAVVVDCYARADATADVDTRLDTLLGAAVQRLRLDPTLGGLVGDAAPQGVAWDFDSDGDQTACASVTFYVRHATAAGSLF